MPSLPRRLRQATRGRFVTNSLLVSETIGVAKPEPTKGKKARRPTLRFLFLLPAALYLVLVFAYPVGFNIWLSFQDFNLKSLITGTSDFVGLNNFANVLKNADFFHALGNTLVFTLVSLAAQFVIGLGLALFFHQKFPFSRVIRAVLILPWLVPGIVATTAWRWLLAENGLVNQVLGSVGIRQVHWLTSPDVALAAVIIVNVWIGISFNLVLLHSGLQGLPAERFEAAQLDGANAWQRLRYIIIPGLRPVIGVVLTLGFVYTLKQFDLIWTLTRGGPGNASQLLSTWSYSLSFDNNSYGLGAAVADFLFIISIAIIIVYSVRSRRNV
jgi:multiple sugar transport system permease protein